MYVLGPGFTSAFGRKQTFRAAGDADLGRFHLILGHLAAWVLGAYLGSVTGRRGTSQKDPYRRVHNQEEGPHETSIGRSVTR